MTSVQVLKAKEELSILNDKFQRKLLLGESFYGAFEKEGIDWKCSILVKLIPEGSGAYSGVVIRQDGKILSFDIDLDSPNFSDWHDITADALKEKNRIQKSKPWEKMVVAYDMFMGSKK